VPISFNFEDKNIVSIYGNGIVKGFTDKNISCIFSVFVISQFLTASKLEKLHPT
jgi:hypothetical protein